MSNNITVSSFEPNMVLGENSYVYLGLSKDYDLEVIFYTPYEDNEQVKNGTIEPSLDYDGFVEIISDMKFPYSELRDGAEYSENKGVKSGIYSKVRNYEHSEVDVTLFEVHPKASSLMVDGKIDTANILKRLSIISDSVKIDTLVAYGEGLELSKDPYSYYGLKRSDF